MKYILPILMLTVLFSCKKEDTTPKRIDYTVTFTGKWSSSSHPTDYPSNAHFSRAVGMTHPDGAWIFRPGETASPGIEEMAETGENGILETEIQALIDQDIAWEWVKGEKLETGTSSETFELSVDANNPYVTLVSMLAPSPDWFVAVVDVDLRSGDDWVNELEVKALVYDAGTDSGTDFTSDNDDTYPKEAIALLTEGTLGDDLIYEPTLATFTFTRK